MTKQNDWELQILQEIELGLGKTTNKEAKASLYSNILLIIREELFKAYKNGFTNAKRSVVAAINDAINITLREKVNHTKELVFAEMLKNSLYEKYGVEETHSEERREYKGAFNNKEYLKNIDESDGNGYTDQD